MSVDDLRRAVLIVLSSCVAGSSAVAQESPAPAPQSPASVEEQPEDVAIGNFAVQANAVEDRLARIDSLLAATGLAADVTETLEEIEAETKALSERLSNLGSRRMMASEINALDTELELLDARTKRQIQRISARAAQLEKLSIENEKDIEVWTSAAQSAKHRSIPAAVRERTALILQGLREARRRLDAKMGVALKLQSHALEVRDAIQAAAQVVNAAQRQQAADVFQRQEPPIWQKRAEIDEHDQSLDSYDVSFSWPASSRHFRTVGGAAAFQLLLVLCLGWLFSRIRNGLLHRIQSREQPSNIPWEQRALEALRHPWAAAFLVGLGSIRMFYPDRVADLIILAWVVALPVWFLVVKDLIPSALTRPLLGVGALATLHIVVTLVSGHPIVERSLLVVELTMAVACAGWILRVLQRLELPKRIAEGLWWSLAKAWTRLALLAAIAGTCATILGYTRLGEEAALVVTIGSIGATVWMALARIFEATFATAIHGGRFDGLRMIRANRDLSSKMAARVIRVAAFATFAWSLGDMTSAWRPWGEAVVDGLQRDLGLGFVETGVTVANLFSFFLVLWLSWALSRFIAFVLGEEILPRLRMEVGVPFALTTFTRYAIIAIGFVAALAVLGIPLDRVTILFSALGVGIGFGLQNLVNNFVSGFVLLSERPIRLHDKIELDGVLGNVSSIGIRASTIRTFDGAEVIVPNGDLISQRVVNWTLAARRQRVTLSVGVAFGTDPNEVLRILRRVAAENDRVFKDPEPLALFRAFGESSLDFELRIFMDPSDVLDVPSAVNIAIHEALEKANIKIPFPQRDLHIRAAPEVQQAPEREAAPESLAEDGADAADEPSR